MEGTCDELGRITTWVAVGPDARPRSLSVSLRLAGLEHPSIAAERLPKALIHRNVPGERGARLPHGPRRRMGSSRGGRALRARAPLGDGARRPLPRRGGRSRTRSLAPRRAHPAVERGRTRGPDATLRCAGSRRAPRQAKGPSRSADPRRAGEEQPRGSDRRATRPAARSAGSSRFATTAAPRAPPARARCRRGRRRRRRPARVTSASRSAGTGRAAPVVAHVHDAARR